MNIEYVVDDSLLMVVEEDAIPRKGDRIRLDRGGDLFRPVHYIVDEVMWVYPDFEITCKTIIVLLLKLG